MRNEHKKLKKTTKEERGQLDPIARKKKKGVEKISTGKELQLLLAAGHK